MMKLQWLIIISLLFLPLVSADIVVITSGGSDELCISPNGFINNCFSQIPTEEQPTGGQGISPPQEQPPTTEPSIPQFLYLILFLSFIGGLVVVIIFRKKLIRKFGLIQEKEVDYEVLLKR